MDASTATEHTSDHRAIAASPEPLARLAVLRSYDILDTPAEGAFEDITRIAALVCKVPIAVVSLVDEHRQWFKSEIGLGIRETPVEVSFCAHALLQDELMEIPDALLDDRFVHNRLVTNGPCVRFYAGAVIKTAEGHALGTVCVLDTQPRKLDMEQRRVLRALARQVMTHLELRKALIEASRSNRYRGRLMAIAGHDLKQPLTTMSMMLDALQPATPEDRERIEVAKKEGLRLSQDLDDLARASRMDDENEPLEPQNVFMHELIAEIADSWSFAARRKGLSLRARVIDAEIRTHPGMLRTILDNLIGNAIKYTPQGSVTIACRRADEGLWIDVTDTGKGIPEADGEDIFKAFRQLDPDADGLGLGLSIVKSTADMLGYPLHLVCGEGKGTTFSVCVPPRHVIAVG
ncbi:GAF domain-containing sensor histidine kinase [Oleiagrimonas soli]|uniref:histidine kinase n=1 Tax=Oleiagrimonas soli TaxID=1543381 RepID=A0A099CWH8_9GAMM|nr:GAF domain-containing sensor histidine kinase [Oleiagrimonas soli]KGI78084.1 hypothetical protein LF63_0106880 [Oleiagrimonas soli]MBB6183498.1 signal transduction histidine kinase [Oleiagrimonas soli]